MLHVHNIIDTDSHFHIDPVTRVVSTKADKLYVAQYDHDSERFTFQIPRYVEEHDMSQCDRIEVHYSNVTRNKKQQNDDVYYVKKDDRENDNDTFFFSWLISSNATQLVGSLKFSISFICLDENGNVSYEWSTALFENIQVLTKLENAALVREKYPDLYNQLKQEILDSIPSSGGEVDAAEVERIIIEYLAANPPAPGEPGTPGTDGDDGFSPTIDITPTEVGTNLTITDVNSTKTVTILNGTAGKDGRDGRDGDDGFSPTIEVTDTENGHLLTITDIIGIKTIEVLNGKDGTGGGDIGTEEEIKKLVEDYMKESSEKAVVVF